MNQNKEANYDNDLNFNDIDLTNENDIASNDGIFVENVDRRKAVRIPRQKAQGKLYYQLKIDNFGKLVFETISGQIIFTLIIVGSLILLFWELGYRVELIDNNMLRTKENNELLAELDVLKNKWSKGDLTQIEKSIKKAEAKIFNSIPLLADWLNSRANSATTLGFNFKYRIGSASKVNVDGTYSMPVSFYLNSKASNENTYIKSLAFIRSIIEENRRLEIVSTKISAENNRITRFSLSINIWVKDPNNIISANYKNGANEDAEFIQ